MQTIILFPAVEGETERERLDRFRELLDPLQFHSYWDQWTPESPQVNIEAEPDVVTEIEQRVSNL
jgi:hypothetical protein